MSAGALRKANNRRLIALALASSFFAASCVGASDEDETPDGESAGTCADFTVDPAAARPSNIVRTSALPSEFDDEPALRMTGMEDFDTTLIPVAPHPESGNYFIVPVLPSNPERGGPVQLQLIDAAGHECDPIDFEITALPKAPGAFQRFAEKLDELNETTQEVFGVESGPEPSDDPLEQFFATAEDWLAGDDNPNSIEKIVDGSAEISPDLDEEAQRVLDGLVEESDAVRQVEETIEELTQLQDPPLREDEWRDPPEDDDPPEVREDPPPPEDDPPTQEPPSPICERLGGDMSAQTLSRLMRAQSGIAQFRDDTDLILDGVGLLNGVVGTGSLILTSGIPNPVTAVTGVIGVSLSAYDLLADASEHLLPGEFTELEFDYEQELYFEDEPDLSGSWGNVRVTARGTEWNMDGRILEQVFSRATAGMSKRFLSKHGADAAAEAAADFLTETFSSGGAAALTAGRSGFIVIPPCDFGPVDITDPEFHEAFFIPPHEPATVVDDLEFEIVATGKAGLIVRVLAEKFGGHSIMAMEPVEAAPIEITIDPAQADGDPGFVASFTVTVENAHNTDVEVSIDPVGGHSVSVSEIGSNIFEITVATSGQREDFPALLRVESAADTGLRAKPDAPPRYETAVIGSDGDISLNPWAVCVEPGATEQFTAEVTGFDNKEIIWDSTAGTIDNNGLFTAPNSEGQIEVRAAAAADRDRNATSRVTVAENCQCWSAFSMPDLQLFETSNAGALTFEKGGAESGTLMKINYDWQDGSGFEANFDKMHVDPFDENVIAQGPHVGETGRFLTAIRGAGLEGNDKLPTILSSAHFLYHLGGNRYAPFYDGPATDLDSSFEDRGTRATVHEFEQVDDEQIWLRAGVSDTVYVEIESGQFMPQPVRIEMQGQFEARAEGDLDFLQGSMFEPWICEAE